MCLAIPGKIVSLAGPDGEVDVLGVLKKVSMVLLPQVKLNDYVLIHAGFAIQVIDEHEAAETLKLIRELDNHASA
ncbi:MAG TPA: HypC/HybG/HupF family hydrogenase formation chaperone [Bacillota bacterium]|nr:HypC/HybG/HupF family hydrogenase formation chaperone [Bacillota bacterium]